MNDKKLQELKDVEHLIADVIKHLKRDKTYGGYLATSNASLALNLVYSILEEEEWKI
ncbi:hypothetical protein UFOVP459_43 [uncultured Caudovirales phage]|uniref:Uncharacterized protein n=1 Tax=uncultured Caudovirales phage TaxID=2100421 RepID=A0A6J5SGI5_9CAUD|nr:hypothetical protein UFOVP459_43 [uncultured Caudovirales phage]CAB4183176.1 hypothetical protein UFOVP1089_42 [uncultured Caudovirales phage]CAB4213050.1 hypothetical protein UFOVP1443_61 [uncultured Caudovirales phage]